MKTIKLAVLSAAIMFLSVFAVKAQSVLETEQDNSASPYFFVYNADSETDRLPLKQTATEVTIAGIIADVKVKQLYKNEGQSTLEAIYIFPASTRAAVYALKMTIGERMIEAKIEKKETARQSYEQALQEGRTATLLEQQRPNVFQMNVGNILPADEITVELSYTEFLLAEKNLYEFVYPTVVGPRYAKQAASETEQHENWVKNPYLHEGIQAPYSFDINLHIAAGMPISEIFSPSHEVSISYQAKDQARISLRNGAGPEGNRDFILKYRLAQKKIDSGLLLQQGEKENFFLLMLQPPERVKPEQIPGREYIFIVDVSGSMHGFPLDISKQLLRDLIGNLRSSDRFNVLLFAAGSNLLAESSLPASGENIEKAIRMIDHESGGGGTELLLALKRALALKHYEGFSRSVVIATDGYVNVEKEAFDLIRRNLGRANFFSFGIGSSVNRFIIEGMARAGMGESFVITRPDEAKAKAEKFRNYISAPVLTGITYHINGFEAYDLEPVAIPDMLSERPVIIFGKWRGEPSGEFLISGKTGNNLSYSKIINVTDFQVKTDQKALKYLWARQRLAMLNDYNKVSTEKSLVDNITRLGLDYNLLTDYTSFIAVDTEIRADGNKIIRVRQPLPLPQGVSDMAVAGSGTRTFGYHKNKQAPYSIAVDRVESEAAEEKSPFGMTMIDENGGRQDLKNELTVYVNLYRKQLEDCFHNATKDSQAGVLKIEIILDRNGKIKMVNLLKDDFKIKDLENSLKILISTWQFKSDKITENTKLIFSLKYDR